MASAKWKRIDYLVHRWLGIALGVLVFVWFASGIVMIYYPWPMPTESDELSRMPAFEVPSTLVGFAAARNAALGYQIAFPHPRAGDPPGLVGGRLMQWNGRMVYSLWRQDDHIDQPAVIVDARTAKVLSPISHSDAIGEARSVVGSVPSVATVDLLDRGDYYLLSGEYQPGFPAYRIQFADAGNTAVYVSRGAGYVIGVVTSLTRWATWFGTVPHWLYFKWLYQRRLPLWLWVSYVLPAIAMLGGLTGLILGSYQLFPRRRRGEWRVSSYRGVSKWHHISGIVFGALVVTWSFSGILEVLGPGNFATGAQITRARGAYGPWNSLQISEVNAADSVEAILGSMLRPVAIDLTVLDNRPGYLFHLQGNHKAWVDGITGGVRKDLSATSVRNIATQSVATLAPISDARLITKYDTYYYARPYREMPLPAWRVEFADADHSAIYLDPVSGKPIGFVNSESRVYRWLRDGLHSFDFPGVNDKRPLWDLVLIPLMLGGSIAAFTGVWLLVRRVGRMV
jgi:PepSY-associated TM region